MDDIVKCVRCGCLIYEHERDDHKRYCDVLCGTAGEAAAEIGRLRERVERLERKIRNKMPTWGI